MVNFNPGHNNQVVYFYSQIDAHARDFAERGEDFTRGYLEGFSGVREFLTRLNIIGPTTKYLGARRALEEMTESLD